MLRAEGISKHFMGIKALEGVTMEIKKGEILGIIGPNGAGKTTLFNVLTGLFFPDSGKIFIGEKEITRLPPFKRVKLGMARTFQNLEIFRDMSVLENIMVGAHTKLRSGFISSIFSTGRKRREELGVKAEAFHLLQLLGLQDHSEEQAVNLSYGNQRRVEIARALASKPDLIFLDEPAAGMNPKETRDLSRLIMTLRKELDLTVAIIEHDMNLIMEICDRIVVMTEGKVLVSGLPHEVRKDEKVLEAYLGGDFE